MSSDEEDGSAGLVRVVPQSAAAAAAPAPVAAPARAADRRQIPSVLSRDTLSDTDMETIDNHCNVSTEKPAQKKRRRRTAVEAGPAEEDDGGDEDEEGLAKVAPRKRVRRGPAGGTTAAAAAVSAPDTRSVVSGATTARSRGPRRVAGGNFTYDHSEGCIYYPAEPDTPQWRQPIVIDNNPDVSDERKCAMVQFPGQWRPVNPHADIDENTRWVLPPLSGPVVNSRPPMNREGAFFYVPYAILAPGAVSFSQPNQHNTPTANAIYVCLQYFLLYVRALAGYGQTTTATPGSHGVLLRCVSNVDLDQCEDRPGNPSPVEDVIREMAATTKSSQFGDQIGYHPLTAADLVDGGVASLEAANRYLLFNATNFDHHGIVNQLIMAKIVRGKSIPESLRGFSSPTCPANTFELKQTLSAVIELDDELARVIEYGDKVWIDEEEAETAEAGGPKKRPPTFPKIGKVRSGLQRVWLNVPGYEMNLTHFMKMLFPWVAPQPRAIAYFRETRCSAADALCPVYCPVPRANGSSDEKRIVDAEQLYHTYFTVDVDGAPLISSKLRTHKVGVTGFQSLLRIVSRVCIASRDIPNPVGLNRTLVTAVSTLDSASIKTGAQQWFLRTFSACHGELAGFLAHCATMLGVTDPHWFASIITAVHLAVDNGRTNPFISSVGNPSAGKSHFANYILPYLITLFIIIGGKSTELAEKIGALEADGGIELNDDQGHETVVNQNNANGKKSADSKQSDSSINSLKNRFDGLVAWQRANRNYEMNRTVCRVRCVSLINSNEGVVENAHIALESRTIRVHCSSNNRDRSRSKKAAAGNSNSLSDLKSADHVFFFRLLSATVAMSFRAERLAKLCDDQHVMILIEHFSRICADMSVSEHFNVDRVLDLCGREISVINRFQTACETIHKIVADGKSLDREEVETVIATCVCSPSTTQSVILGILFSSEQAFPTYCVCAFAAIKAITCSREITYTEDSKYAIVDSRTLWAMAQRFVSKNGRRAEFDVVSRIIRERRIPGVSETLPCMRDGNISQGPAQQNDTGPAARNVTTEFSVGFLSHILSFDALELLSKLCDAFYEEEEQNQAIQCKGVWARLKTIANLADEFRLVEDRIKNPGKYPIPLKRQNGTIIQPEEMLRDVSDDIRKYAYMPISAAAMKKLSGSGEERSRVVDELCAATLSSNHIPVLKHREVVSLMGAATTSYELFVGAIPLYVQFAWRLGLLGIMDHVITENNTPAQAFSVLGEEVAMFRGLKNTHLAKPVFTCWRTAHRVSAEEAMAQPTATNGMFHDTLSGVDLRELVTSMRSVQLGLKEEEDFVVPRVQHAAVRENCRAEIYPIAMVPVVAHVLGLYPE